MAQSHIFPEPVFSYTALNQVYFYCEAVVANEEALEAVGATNEEVLEVVVANEEVLGGLYMCLEG